MYYHALARIGETQRFYCTNETESFILTQYLLPFINGQVVETEKSFGTNNTCLINMKSAVVLSIYKSEYSIPENELLDGSGQVSSKYVELDCTHEFVQKVKEYQSNPSMKSLLQLAFQPAINQAFIIMKFGDKLLDSAYEGVIKPLVHEFGLEAVRVDEIQDSGKINDQILENISKSKIIISDLSGERPNCYYETGFAHALGKNIILTIHKSSAIHFDLSSHRFIQWETESELRGHLKRRLESVLGKT